MKVVTAEAPAEKFDTDLKLPQWQLEPDDEAMQANPDGYLYCRSGRQHHRARRATRARCTDDGALDAASRACPVPESRAASGGGRFPEPGDRAAGRSASPRPRPFADTQAALISARVWRASTPLPKQADQEQRRTPACWAARLRAKPVSDRERAVELRYQAPSPSSASAPTSGRPALPHGHGLTRTASRERARSSRGTRRPERRSMKRGAGVSAMGSPPAHHAPAPAGAVRRWRASAPPATSSANRTIRPAHQP